MSEHNKQNLARAKQMAIAQGKTKGMVNAYVCPDLHTMITKNNDDGYIPEMVGCMQCNQESKSLHFDVNQSLGHAIEWYKPTEGEMNAAMLKMDEVKSAGYKEYILRGGLISKLREKDEEIKPFTKIV